MVKTMEKNNILASLLEFKEKNTVHQYQEVQEQGK